MESITGTEIDESVILLIGSAKEIIAARAASADEDAYNRIMNAAGYSCSAFSRAEPCIECKTKKCKECRRSENINKLKKTMGELKRLIMAIEIIHELDIQ